LAIELFEIDPERAVEAEKLGPDRLAGGVAHPDAREAEGVLQRAIDQNFPETVEPSVAGRNAAAIQNFRPDPSGMGHETVEEPFLQPSGILHPDHHRGELA